VVYVPILPQSVNGGARMRKDPPIGLHLNAESQIDRPAAPANAAVSLDVVVPGRVHVQTLSRSGVLRTVKRIPQ
jgi:hypothetical protein